MRHAQTGTTRQGDSHLGAKMLLALESFVADMNDHLFGPDVKHTGLDLIEPMLKFATCSFGYWKSFRTQIVEARGETLEVVIEVSHTWGDLLEKEQVMGPLVLDVPTSR